jgi:hypothetical protein
MLSVQARIAELEPNRDRLQLDSEEVTRGTLEGKGVAHLVEKNGTLLGYQLLRYPKEDADNLGLDLGFSSNDLATVFHLETIYLLPEIRGFGFQVRLNQLGIETAKAEGFRHAMATVSPLNYPSLSNGLKIGLLGVRFALKYQSNPRIILHLDCQETTAPPSSQATHWVRSSSEHFIQEVRDSLSQGGILTSVKSIDHTLYQLGFTQI